MPDLSQNRVLKYLRSEADEALHKKEFARAESLFLQIVRLQESALGPDHLEVAFMLHNLAIALEAQSKLESAEEVRGRAKTILERNQQAEAEQDVLLQD